MIYIFFIESLVKEWPTGKIIANEINQDYEDKAVAYPCDVRSFDELKTVFMDIVNCVNKEDKVVIQIDAHSDANGITFKSVESQDKNSCTDYRSWDDVTKLLDLLYQHFGDNVLVVFVSCLSASYFSGLSSPHINIIAADGIIDPRKSEERLLVFYKHFCSGSDFNQSYKAMIEKFPLEKEMEIEKKHRAVLKLFN